jgi:hypothetical protein
VAPDETVCVGNASVGFLQSRQRIHNLSVPLAYNGRMKVIWNNRVIVERIREGSIERVGKDFTNYIVFWNGTGIVEQ